MAMPPQKNPPGSLSRDVGIVVIGRNEGERLVACLRSIDPKQIATVYVDSGSTDGSVTAAQEAGATVHQLDMSRPFTAARARNEGFAVLKTLKPEVRFVQFIDGDCELDEQWLGTAAAFMLAREEVAVACGRRRERHPDASIYNWLCDIEWNTPVGETSACGGDSLMRVTAFAAVDGFRPGLIAGEEPELCLRLREKGWKIWRLDAEMTRHDAAIMQLSQWWRRAVRSGHAYAEVSTLHRHSPVAIWKKEFARIVLWGGLLPAVIVLAALLDRRALIALLIYPLQIVRIAARRGVSSPASWSYASFMTLAKFAEFQGVLLFYWRRWRGRDTSLIEYKRA